MKKNDPSVSTFFLLIIIGFALIAIGLFADSSLIERVIHMRLTWFSAVAAALTVWFFFGWRKIYLALKADSMDEYETALSSRYMRMTFFITVTLWLCALFTTSKSFPEFQFDFVQCFHGIGASGFVISVVVLFVLLVLTTGYFVWKWFELRFRP